MSPVARKAQRKKSSGARKSQTSVGPLDVILSPTCKRVPWLVHGFSTRNGGVSEAYGGNALNLGITDEDSRDAVKQNRLRFAAALNVKKWPIVVLKQVHSPIIHIVDKALPKSLSGDGLITKTPELLLSIRVADCIPVLLVDLRHRVVGAFHAGWRGTLARIVERGVGMMRLKFKSQPEDISAVIGPGIGRCCYEVEEDFRDRFAAQFAYTDALFEEVFDSNALHVKYPLLFLNQRAPGHGEPPRKVHLDLTEANRRQLLDAGVPEKKIEVVGGCTSCNTGRFFSHRAEKGVTGRMMGAIGIKSS